MGTLKGIEAFFFKPRQGLPATESVNFPSEMLDHGSFPWDAQGVLSA